MQCISTNLIITCVLNLGIAASLTAQHATIWGTVVEKLSDIPLEGATISIRAQSDSTMIDGTVTDSTGMFVLKDISAGNYNLEIQFIGYVSYINPDIHLTSNTDMGVISLEPSEVLLNEVTVTAGRSLFSYNLDKKVFNVEKDMLSSSSSVSEILQNIPSVTVDIDGGITLRNSGNITFFINGRPSAILRRNASSALSQMPARSIERIEIITNPSAKYRPDGVGGIINLVMKKETHEGFNGQLGVNAGNGHRYSGDVNLNYGTEGLKIHGNYGLRHVKGTRLYSDDRWYKAPETGNLESRYRESGRTTQDALSHQIFTGMNLAINDFNSIELSGSYFTQQGLHHGFADISTSDSTGNPESILTQRQTNDESEHEGEGSISFEHVFHNNEDHTLTFDAVYSSYKESEDLDFEEDYDLPENASHHSNQRIQKSGNQQELTLDYALPIGEEGTFESGYAGEFILENIRYDGTETGLSQFRLNQDVHAWYALYSQLVGNFSFKSGLRAEQVNVASHLKLPLDSLVSNRYFKWFPTLYFGYAFNDQHTLSLSYSKRINRPDADELNPNPEYSDTRNAESGNPLLKPEQVHSLELEYLAIADKFTLNNTLYYRYGYDAFTTIETQLEDSIVLSTIANLDTRQSAGLQTVFSGRISPAWNYSLTGDVFFTTIDASSLGYASDKSTISGNLKAYSLIRLTKTTSLQLNAYYYFPRITPQGERRQFFYANAGLKQRLFHDRASVTFTASDVLHSYKVKRIVRSDTLDQNITRQRKRSVFYLGFTWRLRNYKAKDELRFEGELPGK